MTAGFFEDETKPVPPPSRTEADVEFLAKTVRPVPEVAEHTGLTEAQVRDLIAARVIHARRIGRVWKVSTKSALDYLEGPR